MGCMGRWLAVPKVSTAAGAVVPGCAMQCTQYWREGPNGTLVLKRSWIRLVREMKATLRQAARQPETRTASLSELPECGTPASL